MAGGRERGGQENEVRAGTPRASQIAAIVRGTGNQPATPPPDRAHGIRPAPGTQMDTGTKRCRQPAVSSDHESEPACATDAGERAAQRRSARFAIVAEHDPGPARRQSDERSPWVGQAPRVGE
jgi:hypothetical protein